MLGIGDHSLHHVSLFSTWQLLEWICGRGVGNPIKVGGGGKMARNTRFDY